jgi:hypothetical protein
MPLFRCLSIPVLEEVTNDIAGILLPAIRTLGSTEARIMIKNILRM